MLTADYLDVLPKRIVDLYRQYEESVILDIARRLGKMDWASPSAAWQMQRLTESGLVYENALEQLAEVTGRSEKELAKLFEKAGVKAMKFDDAIYRRAGLDPLPLNLSPAMMDVLVAGLNRTRGVMRNLTQTTALSGQQAFVDAADLAYMQISQGAMDYNTAIRDAVKSVAADGVKVIQYAGGRQEKLDVAMRRTVLTGINKTAGDLQLARANELGVDLVQTSAHIGARNKGTGPANHEGWQGRVFSLSGTHPEYPDFVMETGYGTGEGLCGYNCRHSYYPFFEGISQNAYSEAQVNEYARETVTYNGREMSVYDATQKQRYIERNIRFWKRQANALEAAGLDNVGEVAKVRRYQAAMRDFTKQTGLNRQYEREGGAVKAAVKDTSTKGNKAVGIKTVKETVSTNTIEFVEAKTIEEANAYAVDTFGFDFADYKGLDIKIANEWNRGLTDAIETFPGLKNQMRATGSTQGRYAKQFNDAYERILRENSDLFDKLGYSQSQREAYSRRTARKMAQKTPPNALAYSVSSGDLSGIFVSNKYKASELLDVLYNNIESGFHPVNTNTVRAILDHEIGHQIDTLLSLRINPDLLAYYKGLTRDAILKGLSGYANENMAEFIAEAWSEYINSSNPREIAKTVGDLIMEIVEKGK